MKNELKKKVLNVAKDSWKVIPGISFLAYALSDSILKDKETKKGIHYLKEIGKISGHLIWAGVGIVYLACGVSGLGWNPFEYKEKIMQWNKENNKINSVINYVNKDFEGLSFSEEYQIMELMGIQDSSKNYVITFKDWERAYNKINSLETKFSK